MPLHFRVVLQVRTRPKNNCVYLNVARIAVFVNSDHLERWRFQADKDHQRVPLNPTTGCCFVRSPNCCSQTTFSHYIDFHFMKLNLSWRLTGFAWGGHCLIYWCASLVFQQNIFTIHWWSQLPCAGFSSDISQFWSWKRNELLFWIWTSKYEGVCPLIADA